MDGRASGASRPEETTPPGSSSAAYRRLLRNAPFRSLVGATVFSALGDWIGVLAIIALTADILGPGRAALFAVSGVMVARVVPSLLLGPVAGVFVDRWDRKRVMIATDLGRGVVMALIPFTNEFLTLVLATLVIEVLSALFAPAKDAVLPTLVHREELVQANQINLLTTYGTLPLGGIMYAGLVALAGALAPEGGLLESRPIALPIWFNAGSFWISALLLTRLTFERPSARRPVDPTLAPGAWEQLKEGFRFVGGHHVIRALIAGVMVAAAAAGVVITTGEFFAKLLNAGPSGYGILVAVVGIGLVGGLLVSAPATARVEPERLFSPAIGIAGIGLATTAAMPNLAAVILPAMAMGFGAGITFIVGYTVLQKRADDRIRGRTFGAFNAGVRLAIFASVIAVPAVIGLLGTEVRTLEVVDGRQTFTYPYVFGGIRITLLAAGLLAVGGALVTHRALHRALAAEQPDLQLGADVVRLGLLHGVMVAFEGGDGTGKSTQIRLLADAVEAAGHDVIVTREPGGTPIGERVRELLLARTSEAMGDRTEALLYAAARAQHVDEVVVPALEKGAVVLCDRFVDSSIVYQGAARGLGEDRVEELNRWATTGLVPSLVVVLDIDPVDGLERAVGSGEADRLEAAGLDFHRTVRAAYHRRAATDPRRYLLLDATRPADELHAAILDRVMGVLAGDGPDVGDGDRVGP
jgi:dTMP kinase